MSNRRPLTAKAQRVFRSWLISTLLFTGFFAAVSLLSGYPGGQPAVPWPFVFGLPAVALGVLHVAWFFYSGND